VRRRSGRIGRIRLQRFEARLWTAFAATSLALFALGRLLPPRPPGRDWVWSAWVLSLLASLEATLLVGTLRDVRACLGRGERGQAVGSALGGLGAAAFALLVCGVLLTVDP
jgi:heme exporter protein D